MISIAKSVIAADGRAGADDPSSWQRNRAMRRDDGGLSLSHTLRRVWTNQDSFA